MWVAIGETLRWCARVVVGRSESRAVSAAAVTTGEVVPGVMVLVVHP
jgi:hypothetical protein